MKASLRGITAALLLWTIAKALLVQDVFSVFGVLDVLGVLHVLGVLVLSRSCVRQTNQPEYIANKNNLIFLNFRIGNA